jgi:glycosyltransferase 2 family protein
VQRVLDAIDAFWGYLAAVKLFPLAIGICCHLVKVACTSRAWRNVLVAAYPAQYVRWRSIYAAYLAGVGVNAIFPARAGDVVRLYLSHRAIPTSTYTTLVSSTAVLSIVDFTIATGLFAWALTQGVLPSLDVLPDLPSFDFSWFLRHSTVSLVVLGVLLIGLAVFVFWATGHVSQLKQRVGQAFTVMRTPRRWLRTVVFWQMCDWGLRLATIWFFLGAFGINQSVRNVLLVQATSSLATFVPVSPGGIGTEQAFLVYVLRGQAPRTALLAFSVGMRVTLTTVNVIVGFAAILLTLRTLRFRRVVAPPPEATEN